MNAKLFLSAIVLSTGVLVNLQAQYKVGDAVNDFKLKNTDDKMVSLSSFPEAKGYIIVFTCNTCPVAKKYEKRIIQLNKDFSSKNYPVIAISSNDPQINPGDSFEDMKKKAKNEGYTFPYLYDESQEVARKFGATNTPHIFVVEKEGSKNVLKYSGAIDNNADDPSGADKKYVADAVNSLIAGNEPSVSSTKAVGCGIKWKK